MFSFVMNLLAALRINKFRAHLQLEELMLTDELNPSDQVKPVNWNDSNSILDGLEDRLGKAGFINNESRKFARFQLVIITVLSLIISIFICYQLFAVKGLLVGSFIGIYLAAMSCLYYLRFKQQQFERSITFHLPLVLESLILTVEAGLGILPAIEQLVRVDCKRVQSNPVIHLFAIVYQLSAKGMPLQQALESVSDKCSVKVLRHVLLHLDISGTEGGELIPALRSLSEHGHTEWKLSVQRRVKRLENLVVFPVFTAVIGLMLLTAAVPLVSILELRESLERPNVNSVIQQRDSR